MKFGQSRMHIRHSIFADVARASLAFATALALPALAVAQTGSAPDRIAPYRPGLGDLMTETIQPRHIKLGLAGREKNWTYAAYELHELDEAFQRATHVWPTWQGVPISEMVVSVTTDPIAAADEAIKAADPERFAAAYRQLTEACNTCHQSAHREMVVIKVPEAPFFPDQEFGPPKP